MSHRPEQCWVAVLWYSLSPSPVNYMQQSLQQTPGHCSTAPVPGLSWAQSPTSGVWPLAGTDWGHTMNLLWSRSSSKLVLTTVASVETHSYWPWVWVHHQWWSVVVACWPHIVTNINTVESEISVLFAIYVWQDDNNFFALKTEDKNLFQFNESQSS